MPSVVHRDRMNLGMNKGWAGTATGLLALLVGILLVVPYLRAHSPLFNFIFSPPDLYMPLGETEISLAQTGHTYTIPFRPIYPGNHTVDVLVQRPTEISEPYKGDYTLLCQFAGSDGRVVQETVIQGGGYPFWGASENSGLTIHWFEVPSDVPRGESFVLNVTVKRPDQNFEKRHGKTRLVVRKRSDE